MKRYRRVLGLRAENVEEYKRLHAAVWPDGLGRIKECNIRNYLIYLRRLDGGRHYRPSYFEYAGADSAADMAKMAAAEPIQRWWAINQPCQQPLKDIAPDAWGADKEEVFHCD